MNFKESLLALRPTRFAIALQMQKLFMLTGITEADNVVPESWYWALKITGDEYYVRFFQSDNAEQFAATGPDRRMESTQELYDRVSKHRKPINEILLNISRLCEQGVFSWCVNNMQDHRSMTGYRIKVRKWLLGHADDK